MFTTPGELLYSEQDAMWSLVMVFAEMETGLTANEIKRMIEDRETARLSLKCRREFYRLKLLYAQEL
jgi:hypothetical protein